MILQSYTSTTILAGAIALGLSSCATPPPSIEERFAFLPAEWQKASVAEG